MRTLQQLQRDMTPLKNLSMRFDHLEQRMADTSRPPSVYLEPSATPEPRSSFARVNLKIKDVLPNIPTFDGKRTSIFQFSTACERALELISPDQEPLLV